MSQEIPVLRANHVLPEGAAFHLVRAALSSSRPRQLHGHDFYELIWVQNGSLRHHRADGSKEILTEGDMLFIRPEDQHALQGRGEEPLCVSILMKAGFVRALGKRYDFSGFFWSDQPLPVRARRDIRALSDLNKAALRLEQAPRSALELAAFLLPLMASLADDDPGLPADAPDWLVQACRDAHTPRVFQDGAAGFVRAAGRSHPHVSRMAQKYLGQSPSDYINDIRMTYAARALTGTPEPLADIAASVGLPNMSHFHRLFRARHGVTPHQYRLAHQRSVVQP